LTATLEGESECLIHDVSLSGLAAIASRKYPVGRCVEIAIRYQDEEYVGPVEIRCADPLDSGKTRYGLLGVFDTAEGSPDPSASVARASTARAPSRVRALDPSQPACLCVLEKATDRSAAAADSPTRLRSDLWYSPAEPAQSNRRPRAGPSAMEERHLA
jgi:hypothetical protein